MTHALVVHEITRQYINDEKVNQDFITSVARFVGLCTLSLDRRDSCSGPADQNLAYETSEGTVFTCQRTPDEGFKYEDDTYEPYEAVIEIKRAKSAGNMRLRYDYRPTPDYCLSFNEYGAATQSERVIEHEGADIKLQVPHPSEKGDLFLASFDSAAGGWSIDRIHKDPIPEAHREAGAPVHVETVYCESLTIPELGALSRDLEYYRNVIDTVIQSAL